MLRHRSALLLLVRAVHAHAEAACAAPPPGVNAYPLIQKWSAGNQSYVLRFALPPEEGALGWRGVKAFLDGEDEKTGGPATLTSSMSRPGDAAPTTSERSSEWPAREGATGTSTSTRRRTGADSESSEANHAAKGAWRARCAATRPSCSR